MANRPEDIFDQTISENVQLAPFTTLGIGGPARYFARAETVELLSAGAEWARERGLPLFVLAGGSNIVVSDDGFPGLVLHLSIRGIESRLEGDYALVTVAAGEDWDPLVEICVFNNWGGFECLSGIPGRVGATPIQNVGAYGQDISETFVCLDALDRESGRMTRMTGRDCDFGYRSSRFRTRDRGRFIITSVTYRLQIDAKPSVRYSDLEHYLAEQRIANPRLSDVRQAVLAIRRMKAMVIDPNDPDSRSVGSFFMNPIITNDEFERVKGIAQRVAGGSAMPGFVVSNGVKLSAAWLIERAGFQRGYTQGSVGISSKHSLAIVNRGGGTAREVIALAGSIKARVADMFGVELNQEPILVGF